MAEPQQDWFASNAPTPPPAGTWEDRGIGGKVWHPATPPNAERVDSDVVGGIPLIGGISPEMVAAGGVGAARALGAPVASATAKVVAGGKALVEQVTPQIKYELTKHSLELMGVPAPLAMAAALAVSGFQRGAKEPTSATTKGPHLDRSAPVSAGSLSQQEIADRVKFGTGTAPPPPRSVPKAPLGARSSVEPPAALPAAGAPPVPSSVPSSGLETTLASRSGAPTLPDQKALNEAALAARRAAYQEKLKQATYTKPHMNAVESKAYLELRHSGKSPEEARDAIAALRAFQERFGTPSPTAAETRFPKGMRGKTPGAE